MSYYYTDIKGLTAEDYMAAGAKATAAYDDTWFACDVLRADGKQDTGTVLVEHNGITFEVWLERTWHLVNAAIATEA